jgi:hypothetical protein
MANKLVTVQPSGGDYTTLAAAITGELSANSDLTATGLDGILTISIEDDWSSGVDTSIVNDAGFTQDSTHYLHITTDSANKSGTSWDTNKYINSNSFGDIFTINGTYTRVSGLQISNSNSSTGLKFSGSNCLCDSVLCNFSSISFEGIKAEGDDAIIINSIVIGSSVTTGIAVIGSNAEANNCTVVGCTTGISTSAAGQYLINCYAGNCTTDYGGTLGTLTTCYSEDGSRSTSTATYSTSTFTNVTGGSEDLALVSGSGLLENGTNLSSGTFPFNYDIVGTSRPQSTSWDVGASELVVSSGGSIIVLRRRIEGD